jgi:fumarate hydratase class II
VSAAELGASARRSSGTIPRLRVSEVILVDRTRPGESIMSGSVNSVADEAGVLVDMTKGDVPCASD